MWYTNFVMFLKYYIRKTYWYSDRTNTVRDKHRLPNSQQNSGLCFEFACKCAAQKKFWPKAPQKLDIYIFSKPEVLNQFGIIECTHDGQILLELTVSGRKIRLKTLASAQVLRRSLSNLLLAYFASLWSIFC
jgi:hypothetical protein